MAVKAPKETPGQALSPTAEISAHPLHFPHPRGVLSFAAAKMPLSSLFLGFWREGGQTHRLDILSPCCGLHSTQPPFPECNPDPQVEPLQSTKASPQPGESLVRMPVEMPRGRQGSHFPWEVLLPSLHAHVHDAGCRSGLAKDEATHQFRGLPSLRLSFGVPF